MEVTALADVGEGGKGDCEVAWICGRERQRGREKWGRESERRERGRMELRPI